MPNKPSAPYDDFTSEQINAITEGLVEHYMNETSMAWRHEAYAKATEVLSDYMLCRQLELTLPFDKYEKMKVEVGVRPFYKDDPFGTMNRALITRLEGAETFVQVMVPAPMPGFSGSFIVSPHRPPGFHGFREVPAEEFKALRGVVETISYLLGDYPQVSWANHKDLEYADYRTEIFTSKNLPSQYLQKKYPTELTIISQALLRLGIPEKERPKKKKLRI